LALVEYSQFIRNRYYQIYTYQLFYLKNLT